MTDLVRSKNICLFLIQIDEAHSSSWPMAIKDQPEPHRTFEDRIKRAQYFVDKYKPPYQVYIDGFDNVFAETFQAWPDQYYCVDQNKKIIKKSEYGINGGNEAKILLDYTDLIKQL